MSRDASDLSSRNPPTVDQTTADADLTFDLWLEGNKMKKGSRPLKSISASYFGREIDPFLSFLKCLLSLHRARMEWSNGGGFDHKRKEWELKEKSER